MNFNTFKQAVAKQFNRMAQHQLFTTSVEKDELWALYLAAFPEGTNPMYRERTEHDCSCCKQFIRNIGNVVAIIDGQMESIWDISIPNEPAYQTVANHLAYRVKNQPIANVYLHYERTVGTDKNFEQLTTGQQTWEHFFVNLPATVIKPKHNIGTLLGEVRANYDVSLRGLTEIPLEVVDTVLELIAQGSLYRGEEHKRALETFRRLKVAHDSASDKSLFVWQSLKDGYGRIRNTVIGTLLVDLAEGKDLEYAVKSFEQKVAPANYKRPTALITQSMIKQAQETIEGLGLLSALERRHATLTDITVNNILFADRDAKKAITGTVFDELAATAKTKAPNLDRIEEVGIEKFIADILPKAESLEVLLENCHASNLVSLIAPVDPTAGQMFKWPNNFSWSYEGEMADSIKERVKAAGGNVTGELCCRLAWDYKDDLDFHMIEPDNHRIYFGERRIRSQCGGMLDVDANGADGIRENPVENIFYERLSTMKEGEYRLLVNNYSRRSDGVGFEVEIDIGGTIHSIAYDKVLRTNETVEVAKLKYSKANGVKIIESLPTSQTTRSIWGVPTQTFHRVSTMMLSPNHWDGHGVGNKHYFFIVDGCKNEAPTRGFFNEFLSGEMDKHRKVFEVLGSKMKVAPADHQLSGLGFSSTQRNSLVCRVKGSFTRTIKIVF